MISSEYINIQTEISHSEKRTSGFIREYVFFVVHKALLKYYGENYSTRCLQSSAAINMLLSGFGIKSTIFTGSICTIEVHKTGDTVDWSWSGFWGKEHHIFVISEFSDLIDFTIGQLHLHPHTINHNSLPMLPFWWSPINKWPPLIKYLPESPVEISLAPNEMNDLNNFLICVTEINKNILQNYSPDDIKFWPIITGIEALNEITQSGNAWLNYASRFCSQGIELPEWIIKREKELVQSLLSK